MGGCLPKCAARAINLEPPKHSQWDDALVGCLSLYSDRARIQWYKNGTNPVRCPTLISPTQPMPGAGELPGYTTVDFVLSPKHSPLPSHDNSPTIGGQRVTRPLITIQQLKSHLRLLGMFALMKEKVEVPETDPQLVQTIPPLANALSPGKRWIWFLELAVERFVLVAIGHPTVH